MPTSSVPVPTPSIPARIDPDRETTPRSSAEIRALLDARQSDAQFRLQALKAELTNPASVTVGGVPLPDAIRAHVLRYGGYAAAGGLVLGVISGLWGRRGHAPDLDDLDLARARLAAFLDDAAERVHRGASTADALRHTLRETPVVLAPPTGQVAAAQAKSSVGQAVDMAVKSAVGFALKAATDQLTKKLTGKPDTLTAVAEAPERA
ncbi:MAG TPA: hypothetical protein VF594_11180 [Rubricoccaceae bacterium]|jgi:hypothetical protein